MRIFSPFGILGLLHVARGGELDSFASDRARHVRDTLHARNSPAIAPSGSGPVDNASQNLSEPIALPLAFQKAQERSEHHRRAVDKLDIDDDGHVTADELLKTFEFWWGDAETVQRMLHTLGFANVEEALKEYTAGNDKISKSDLFELAETRPHEGAKSTSHCPAMHTKIESCPLYTVNRCSRYLHAAETFCSAGYRNIVETCIMSESCSNVCECIESAEKAAHNEAAIAIVNQQGTAVVQTDLHRFNNVGFPETGLQSHSKRWAWLIYAIIVAIIGVQIDLAVRELTRRHEESRWLDSVSWDGKGLPPACSVYVFWGRCGYIGTGTARNCPDGAERVYGNSCKDHWRYGSKACGFLGAKCQSLCVKVNPSGCPCSMFDWAQFDDQDMPGSDIRSFSTTKVSECRDACGKDTNCKAFVITPPKGNKDESPNCWLKNAQRQTMRSDGATTFFKKGGSSSECSSDVPITSDGVYDGDWWPGETTTKRDSVDVVPRAGKDDKLPFLFNRNDNDYTVAIAFIVALYRRFLANDLTYRNHNYLRAPIGATIIDRSVTAGLPSNPPYVSNNALPQWTGPEIGYRVTAVFRNLFNLGRNNVDDPVRQFLVNSPANSAAATAQFPATVRAMLTTNSAAVHAQSRGTDIWIGTNRAIGSNGGVTTPFQGLQAGYDSRLTYWQRGNAGPFSLEAAFILATQLAGVNFRNLARAAERPATGRHGDPWWIGVLTTARVNPQCLNEETASGVPTRRFGRYMPSDGTAQHDTDAGVYMAFDLDPNLPEDSPNRNVFVFVVHAIDRNSVVRVPNEQYLRDINLSTYTPGNDKASSYFWNGGSSSSSAPAAPPQNANARTRVFAHAHAAIVPFRDLQNWLGSQGSQRFPIYTQIGYNHFYILTEDDTIFERNRWLDDPNRDSGGS